MRDWTFEYAVIRNALITEMRVHPRKLLKCWPNLQMSYISVAHLPDRARMCQLPKLYL
jgi:hypothetical protein